MFLKSPKSSTILLYLILCVIQCEISVSYKTEVQITPAPPEESTTKKSGFFGGIKKWFGGSAQTTVDPLLVATTAKPVASLPVQNPKSVTSASNNQKPPPLVISNAPLVPLGPRPDTPSSSPFGAGQPQWPKVNTNGIAVTPTTISTSPHPAAGLVPATATLKPSNQQNTNNLQSNFPKPGSIGQPNLAPGFTPYQSPKSQPSGLDLSYGGRYNAPGHPQQAERPGFGMASSTTSTSKPISTSIPTTTARSQLNFDLRGEFDTKNPTQPGKENLPPSRQPSVKEDYPALPTPKFSSNTPSSSSTPSSPSAWNKPLPTSTGFPPSSSITSTTIHSTLPKVPATGTNGGVSFVPHTDSTTTVRPGFEKQGNSLATDDEIRSLTELLYTKEVNSQLNLVTVNLQGKTRSIDSTDEAPQPLLEVDSKALESPTIAKMRLLFNNYEHDTLVNEHVTPMERKEENDFVDAVMATNVMRQAMLFLQNKGIISPDPKTHRDMVKELWFTQYSRGNGKIGSSGFEHVFVNEVKNGTIIGLHNWVYFYDEEKAGHLDYKGYLNQLDLGAKGKVLKVRFTHNGLNKPVNTLFVGTSPELELALYTVCFKLRPDRTCPVSLGNNGFGIVTYSWRYRGKSLIGSAYPEI